MMMRAFIEIFTFHFISRGAIVDAILLQMTFMLLTVYGALFIFAGHIFIFDDGQESKKKRA